MNLFQFSKDYVENADEHDLKKVLEGEELELNEHN